MPAISLANHEFRVGDSLVQPGLARIQRDGKSVHVTPRAMAVLVHLAEANGAVVSRSDLLDAVWPNMAVTPDALSQCLVELRRVFCDDSKSPETIETIRKIGVRLMAPITVVGAGEQAPTTATHTGAQPASEASGTPTPKSIRNHETQRLWRLFAGTVVAIVALGASLVFWSAERSELQPSSAGTASGRPSIVVLPLDYDSSASDRVKLFADAIHDELLVRLANIEALDKVISRPVALGYRGTQKTTREIGQELGVGAVLTGQVRGVGDEIKLTVDLSDTESNAILWGDTYTRTLTAEEFFAIQSGLALAVVSALDEKLSADELARIRDVPTTSTRALEFYLRGNEYWRRNNDPNKTLPLIVQQYEKATEEDRTFALAWARLGIAYTGLHFRGLDRTPARLALANAAIRTAFELAPALPEAHLARAAYLGRGLADYDGALAELAIAEPGLRQDPEFYFLRAGLYRRVRELERALADHVKMLELDPGNVVYLRQRSQVEISMRDYAAVERTLDRIIDLAPDDGTAYVDRVFLDLYAHGDTALANRYERSPPLDAGYATALASTYVRWLAAVFDRDYARALSVLDSSSEEPVFDGDVRNSFSPKSLLYARTHLLAGNRTEAMRHFLQAKSVIDQQLTSPHMQVALAEVNAALGDRKAAAAALARVSEAASGRFRLAMAIRVLVPLGEYDRALEEIDDVLSGPSKWTIEGLSADPRLDPVRGDPRFAALVAKHKSE